MAKETTSANGGQTMSALAMILAAVMTLPVDGPEKVSGEMRQEPQALNLKGSWDAVFHRGGQILKGEGLVVARRFSVRVPLSKPGSMLVIPFGEAVDEGSGNLRIGKYLGIYKRDGDRLRICLSPYSDERPNSFQVKKGYYLIELRPLYPNK